MGAGAILVTRNQQVRGLWASAIMEMAFGTGYCAGAIICFLFIYISLKFLTRIDGKISQHLWMMRLYCELSRRKGVANVILHVQNKKFRITNVEISPLGKEVSKEVEMIFMIHTDGKTWIDTLMKEFETVDGLSFAAAI